VIAANAPSTSTVKISKPIIAAIMNGIIFVGYLRLSPVATSRTERMEKVIAPVPRVSGAGDVGATIRVVIDATMNMIARTALQIIERRKI
jgi:hypothetical protein